MKRNCQISVIGFLLPAIMTLCETYEGNTSYVDVKVIDRLAYVSIFREAVNDGEV